MTTFLPPFKALRETSMLLSIMPARINNLIPTHIKWVPIINSLELDISWAEPVMKCAANPAEFRDLAVRLNAAIKCMRQNIDSEFLKPYIGQDMTPAMLAAANEGLIRQNAQRALAGEATWREIIRHCLGLSMWLRAPSTVQ